MTAGEVADMDDQADRRMRAYAALEGLRQSIPLSAQHHGSAQGVVQKPSIRQYEGALDDLAATGENVDQYRLESNKDGDLPSAVLAADLQARVSAVLGYFTIRDA